MDEVVKKLVALGTPALILIAIMAATGLPGAAAVTAALAILGGPGGMFGGVIVLGILGLLADAIAKYGVEEIFKRVVDGLRANGKSCAVDSQSNRRVSNHL